MKWFGIVYLLMGAAYLIYSVLCRDKLTYFSRGYSKISEMRLIKPDEFLKLQLKFSIVNAIYLIVYGILIIIFNLNDLFSIAGQGAFYFIHFLLIVVSKNKGYVDYKVGKTP